MEENATELAPTVVAAARARYETARAAGLGLDMTRGKPSPDQLARSHGLLAAAGREDTPGADGTDCRNYGGDPRGLPEMRQIFADILGVAPELVFVGGNASLQWMHDVVVQAMLVGVPGGDPWGGPRRSTPVKFLCPSPGYDRHFALLERYGIDMLPVAMGDDGPDVEEIARLAGDDPNVKGMFCVPRYSNPTGVTYTDDVVDAIASIKAAAPDFRVLWDDAYALHSFDGEPERLANFLERCAAHGADDRAIIFTSFSKVTFGGAGLAAVAASPRNCDWVRSFRSIQTIGPNKLNQLAHVRFFESGVEAVREHMRGHAELIRPKFEMVLRVLDEALGGLGVAEWSRPRGGYFVSLDTAPGNARAVVEMAGGAGVKLTPAGATYPYGLDPEDRNIRIAPTLPSVPEIEAATRLLADCIVLVAAGEAVD